MALLKVQEYTRSATREGGFAIAVGLDIANAFNSVLWDVILAALEGKKIPSYLRKGISSYLSCRAITYRDDRDYVVERSVFAGVPQGSVLGPLLWNVAFDSVLRLKAEEGCYTVCYADDTLLVSVSDSLFEAIIKINTQIARVVRHIDKLGLRVAEAKTEAILFCRKKPKAMPTIRVRSTNMHVGDSMKYLGVIVDSTWNFRTHFEYVGNKIARVSRALNRIMPNLRGPGERKRQLYAKVLTSVAMYASPVWDDRFSSSPNRVLRSWHRFQRTIAIRVIAAYRTVSYDAAALLARMPPWTLEATMRGRIFSRISEHKRCGTYDRKVDSEIRDGEALLIVRQWNIQLCRPGIWGHRTTIRPKLRKLLDRNFGEINYYSAQLLMGHGSFGHFLWRIGKRETTICLHCSQADDTLEHTLTDCPSWGNFRTDLRYNLGLNLEENLTLDIVFSKIIVKENIGRSFLDSRLT